MVTNANAGLLLTVFNVDILVLHRQVLELSRLAILHSLGFFLLVEVKQGNDLEAEECMWSARRIKYICN